MARRASGKEHIRNIQRSAKRSYHITIPIRLIRELGWRERQKVVVRRFGAGIRIKDWPVAKRKSKVRLRHAKALLGRAKAGFVRSARLQRDKARP